MNKVQTKEPVEIDHRFDDLFCKAPICKYWKKKGAKYERLYPNIPGYETWLCTYCRRIHSEEELLEMLEENK